MSTKKYTNVEVSQIHDRLMELLDLKNKTALALELGTTLQNLKNREDRGVNKLDDVALLCNRLNLDWEYVFHGRKAVLQPNHVKPFSEESSVRETGVFLSWCSHDEKIKEIVKLLMEDVPEFKDKVLNLLRAKKAYKKAVEQMGGDPRSEDWF